MIPTRQTCEQLWEDMKLSDDLKNHLTAVAEFSVRLAAALNHKGLSLSIPLIEAAALLHDIEKGKPHHAMAGANTLEALGFAEIAPIVKAHMRLPAGFQPEITELTVVFLADKLFIGSKPVCLEERYAKKMLIYRDQPSIAQAISGQLEMSRILGAKINAALGADSLLKIS